MITQLPIAESPKALKMRDADFRRVSAFVKDQYGINLTPAKKVMVESRLRKRLTRTNHDNYSDYVDYVFTGEGAETELLTMIDLITTNKTEFYREPAHFSLLSERLLGDLYNSGYGSDAAHPLRVWSAACSTGEEPYTLAMVLDNFRINHPEFVYRILGTDISRPVLEVALSAVYPEEKVESVPKTIRHRCLLRGTGNYEGMVRVHPALRQNVGFERLNLMESRAEDIGTFDIAFLRNVIIYFERQTKFSVVSQVLERVRPGGYLFVGHSETLFDMKLPLRMVQPTVYQKV